MDPELQQAWLRAADAGELSTMQLLLKDHPQLLNARLDHQALKSPTALHVCAWRNQSDVAAFLLAQGADVGLLDETGMTALQTDLLRICLEKMRSLPLLRSSCLDARSPVSVAAFRRKLAPDRSTYHEIETDIVDLLLAHDIDANNRSNSGDTALITAVELGLIKHVEKLVAHGADALVSDGHGRTALDISGEKGFVDIVELLMDHFPDLIATAGETALTMAIHLDYSEVLEVMYDCVLSTLSPADRETLGGSLLQTAVEYGSPLSVKYLIEKKASVCWTNKHGENAVQLALSSSQPDILDLLLSENTSSNTCLAQREKCSSSVPILRHSCTDMEVLRQPEISFQEGDDILPELFAVMKPWRLQIMEVLVRHGAQFEFSTSSTRDEVAPYLASCLQHVDPSSLPKVLVNLVNCVSVKTSAGSELRNVLLPLVWAKHTREVLTILLLMLFSHHSDSQEALAILDPWMQKFNANIVTGKLLSDTLKD